MIITGLLSFIFGVLGGAAGAVLYWEVIFFRNKLKRKEQIARMESYLKKSNIENNEVKTKGSFNALIKPLKEAIEKQRKAQSNKPSTEL